MHEVELDLDPARNFFHGANGAGKTSLLEAVFLLGRGRSFRTRQARSLVQHGESELSVYGDVDDGVRVRRLGAAFGGRLERRVDGAPASGADVAKIIAVQAIGPDSHRLIEGGPSERRRFLDWGVFHVEHSYLEAWQRYRRVLGQRNAALQRPSGAAAELRVWTQALAEAGVEIDRFRQSYVERLAANAAEHAEALLGQPLSFQYRRGWRADLGLEAALDASTARDRSLGHTEPGPHRADLVLQINGHRVQDDASRGQQKLVAAALVLAQESVVAALATSRSVLLVDDPAAELDRAAFERLLARLGTIRSQLFFTGLTPLVANNDAPTAVFHVEQGRVYAL